MRAADGIACLAAASASAGVHVAFGRLGRVAYRSFRHTHTQWQVVFDLFNDRIYYRTQDHRRHWVMGMGRLDFACADPIRMRDISNDGDGFTDDAQERNRR